MAAVIPYRPKEQAAALLTLALRIPFARAIVGLPGQRGIRFVFLGLLAVETYLCFDEPTLEPWRGLRLIFWRTPKKRGQWDSWHPWKGLIRIGGSYAVGTVHSQYRQDWKGNSRRAAEKHSKDATVLRPVPLKEFATAYHRSQHIDPMLRQGMIWVARDHLKTHSQDVSVLLAYTREGQLGGGAIFVDHPDVHSSQYIASFLTPLGRKQDFGYAYIDWWYQHMLERKLVWAEFGLMWQPGDPVSWKGSTEFKSRFRPALYTYKKYMKVTWKRA